MKFADGLFGIKTKFLAKFFPKMRYDQTVDKNVSLRDNSVRICHYSFAETGELETIISRVLYTETPTNGENKNAG